MDQTFNAGFDFDESAVGHQIDDLTGNQFAFGIFFNDIVPGIAGLLLETEGDTFFVFVDADDGDFEFLTDGEDFAGMVDTAPGDVGDVEQTVNAAEIDEGTEVGDIFDNAHAEIADSHIRHEFAALFAEAVFEKFAAGNNDVVTIEVDLDDLDIEFLVEVVIHVANRADIELGTGQEGGEAFDIDHDTALDAMTHEAFDDVAFAVFSGDALPGFDGFGFFETQRGHVLTVFDLFEIDIDLVTDIDFVVLDEFRSGDESFGFVTDIDQNSVLTFGGDGTFDDFAFAEGVGGFLFLEQIAHAGGHIIETQETLCEIDFLHVCLVSC